MNKKVIVLVMSARSEFFTEQVNVCKKTYASDLPENWRFIYYDGNWTETRLDDDHLMIQCLDSLDATYRKTYEALKYLRNFEDFDYIIRLNTSTYLNTQLAYKLIESGLDDSVIYGSELYSLSEATAPYPMNLYTRGNCMIMSRHIVDIILSHGLSMLYSGIVDDQAIGCVLNSYYMSKGDNYLNHIKGLPHSWYKCIDVDGGNGHANSTYANDNLDICARSVTTQIKCYSDRAFEEEHYYELHEYINKSNPDIEYAKSYMTNPSIFLGSILGYVPFDKWLEIDKQQLYIFEVTHKAADDDQINQTLERVRNFNMIHSF